MSSSDPMNCPYAFEHARRAGRMGWYVRQTGTPEEQLVPGSGPFWRKITAMRVAADMTTAAATAHYSASVDRTPRDEQGRTALEIIGDFTRTHPQRTPQGFRDD